MRVVGIKVLKDKLSEYIRLAAGGDVILVTDRGIVVAELTAPRAGRGEALQDAFLADAVRNGWLEPPILPAGFVPGRVPVAPAAEILGELDRDRSER